MKCRQGGSRSCPNVAPNFWVWLNNCSNCQHTIVVKNHSTINAGKLAQQSTVIANRTNTSPNCHISYRGGNFSLPRQGCGRPRQQALPVYDMLNNLVLAVADEQRTVAFEAEISFIASPMEFLNVLL